MAEENNMTRSELNRFFNEAQRQEPVLKMDEVKELISDSPFVNENKKTKHLLRWIGIILLITLANFGIYYLWNKDKGADESNVSATVSNPVLSNQNSNSQSLPSVMNSNEIGGDAEMGNKNKAEGGNTNKNTRSNSDKGVLQETFNEHFEGDAIIHFTNGNCKIKMIVSSANEIEELNVNDQVILKENFDMYKNEIAEGLKIKAQDHKNNLPAGTAAKDQPVKSAKQELMNEMLNQLRADGLISGSESFDFRLTGKELFLNDERQTGEVFEKYKQVYEKVSGEKMPERYNLHIKH